MDYDLIDLGGFTRKNTKILADTPDYQRTRTVFDHRLILITEVDKKDQKIKVSSNFEWKRLARSFDQTYHCTMPILSIRLQNKPLHTESNALQQALILLEVPGFQCVRGLFFSSYYYKSFIKNIYFR